MKKYLFRPRTWLMFLSILLIPFTTFSQDFPKKSNRLVNDYAQVLFKQELIDLEKKLVAYDRESSVQIAIVILKTLDGYPIDRYAFELGEKWGVGQKETDNGALIVVSIDERKIWIATGYGLEATLTDAMTKRIIENEVKPAFKRLDYYGGLAAASDAMILATRGEYQGNGGNAGGKKKQAPLSSFFLILLVFAVIWLMKARQVRSYAQTNHLGFWAAWMLLNSSSRRHGGSWSSFSGGSGGFGGGGFGGGSFGGGGAGGSW